MKRLWWISLLLQSVLGLVPVIRYKVTDGTKEDSYIGNIGQDGEFDSTPSERSFQMIKGFDLLEIDEKSGDLRTRIPIDREALCGRRESPDCIFEAEIITKPQSLFKLFKVELEVEDLNDNAPVFPNSKIDINLSEETQLGSLIRLDSATDADSEPFRIKSYSIRGESGSQKYFELNQQKLNDGSLIPMLRLVRQLDHEKLTNHKLTLIAHDGGEPPLVGEMEVNINVLDVNDHSPVFSQSEYSINLEETMALESKIFSFNATDLDSGEFGRVRYSYGSLVSAETRKMFRLDADTGDVILSAGLDYETKKIHNLYVEARDQGMSGHLAYATLTIHVTDINDNLPVVEVSFMDSLSEGVAENIQIGSFVAFVSVSDSDDSSSSRPIKTELIDGKGGFRLEVVDEDSNRFIIRTASELDRERIPEYQLIIRATDSQKPDLVTEKRLIIPIYDVNDNAPYFAHAMYHISIDENNMIGQPITALKAMDPDEGANGDVTYSLGGDISNGKNVDASSFFEISSTTGELFAKKTFDAERDPLEYVLKVYAKDSGSPPLIGQCEIKILIGDKNDNRPRFEKSTYAFSLEENNTLNHIIGSVRAIDLDLNAHVTYRMVSNFQNRFHISPQDGVLMLTSKLDFERDSNKYNLTIIAEDEDGNFDTTHVIVAIRDINDNEPKITWPLPHRDILEIPSNGLRGDLIGQLQAEDRDGGNNGRIKFNIEENRGFSLVDVNELNGELRLARDVGVGDFGSHPILVRVEDLGSDSLFTTARINLYVSETGIKNDTEYEMLLSDFQIALMVPADATVSKIALLLVAVFAILIVILCIVTASVFFSHRMQRKEVYRCTDRTSRSFPPPPGGPKSYNQDLTNQSSRNEFSEIKWKMEKIENWKESHDHIGSQDGDHHVGVNNNFDGWHGNNHSHTVSTSDVNYQVGVIENSFHSTVDSGRDSGSQAESASGSEDFKMEKKKRAEPSFSTFMDESDRDSVEISDYDYKKAKLGMNNGVIANRSTPAHV